MRQIKTWISALNGLMGLLIVLLFPVWQKAWEAAFNGNDFDLYMAVALLAFLQGAELWGFKQIMPRLRLQERRFNPLWAFPLTFVFLLYLTLTSLPAFQIVLHLQPTGLIIALTILVLLYLGKIFYYPHLLYKTKTESKSALHQRTGEIALAFFVHFNYLFYLSWIVSGVPKDMPYTLTDVLWATLPTLMIFVPLEYPFILEKILTAKNWKNWAGFVVSVLWITGITAWALFP